MQISIDAEVVCTDGPCGRIASFVVDPQADELTHVIVSDQSLLHVERLLPLKDVRSIDDHSAQIDRSSAEVKSLERFTEIIYVDQADPQVMHAALEGTRKGHIRWAEGRPGLEMLMLGATDVPVEHELVPRGEVVLHRGSCVVASDRCVAWVEGLLIDRQTGKISHLVMKAGHLWHKHELIVPVAEIECIHDDAVFLRRP